MGTRKRTRTRETMSDHPVMSVLDRAGQNSLRLQEYKEIPNISLEKQSTPLSSARL